MRLPPVKAEGDKEKPPGNLGQGGEDSEGSESKSQGDRRQKREKKQKRVSRKETRLELLPSHVAKAREEEDEEPSTAL